MQRVVFGTQHSDHMSIDNNGAMFGFDGDDTLVAHWNNYNYYQAFLVGGDGNDRYIADGDLATIIDTSGRDSVQLPGRSSEYLGAFVNG